jgi:hypothetical protein
MRGAFDGQDVMHLRTDVDVQKLEGVAHASFGKHATRGKDLCSCQSKRGMFAAAVAPFSCAWAMSRPSW